MKMRKWKMAPLYKQEVDADDMADVEEMARGTCSTTYKSKSKSQKTARAHPPP